MELLSNEKTDDCFRTSIKFDENLKELLRIARKRIDPKDFKVDVYIKKIDNNDFYFLTNRMFDAQSQLREIYKENKTKLNFILTDKKIIQNLIILLFVQHILVILKVIILGMTSYMIEII